MTEKDLLFACLRQEFFGIPCTVEWSEVSSRTAKELYALAKAHDMAHAVGNALQKAGKKSDAFQKQLVLAIARRELQNNALEEICSVLAEAEIPHLPLKGSVLCHLYPAPFLRTGCDIDLLVKETDIEKSAVLLKEKLGYVREEKVDFHDLSLYSPGGVHLELHFSLKEGKEPMDGVLETVWEHAYPAEGFPFRYRMEQEFLLFHITAHMAYHFAGGGCGIKPFADLLLLQEAGGYEEEGFRTLCRRGGLEVFYENALALAGVWFLGEGHTELTERMERFLLKGGVYGTQQNAIAAKQTRAGGKTKYALSRIWMPKEQLERRYSGKQVGGVRLPYYQAKRWVETVFGGRIKNAVGELNANRTMDASVSEQVEQMLTDLEL